MPDPEVLQPDAKPDFPPSPEAESEPTVGEQRGDDMWDHNTTNSEWLTKVRKQNRGEAK